MNERDKSMNSCLSALFSLLLFLLLMAVFGAEAGSGGNNHPRINLRTRAHLCSLLFTYTPLSSSRQRSLFHFLLFCGKGDGGRSNTPGRRCLNSRPKALICAYQSGTDNPWRSFLVNQEQIEFRQRSNAFVAGDNNVCTYTHACNLHTKGKLLEGIDVVSLHNDIRLLWSLATINHHSHPQ